MDVIYPLLLWRLEYTTIWRIRSIFFKRHLKLIQLSVIVTFFLHQTLGTIRYYYQTIIMIFYWNILWSISILLQLYKKWKKKTKWSIQERKNKTLQNDEGFIQSNYKNNFITLLKVSNAAIIRIKCIGKCNFLDDAVT